MTDIQPERNLAPLSLPLSESIQLARIIPAAFIYLFIGFHAWRAGYENAELFPTRTIVIPPWYAPDLYTYPVERCRILIIETHPETASNLDYVFEIAMELKRQGADMVFYMHEENDESNLLTL